MLDSKKGTNIAHWFMIQIIPGTNQYWGIRIVYVLLNDVDLKQG